ncbi:MAG: Protein sidekick-2 [Acidobacteriales bacterium]|nr:Protein sidekick-2 [Terriglobales bacterium]
MKRVFVAIIFLIANGAYAQEVKRPTTNATQSFLSGCTGNTHSGGQSNIAQMYDSSGESTSGVINYASTNVTGVTDVSNSVMSGWQSASGTYSSLTLKIKSSCVVDPKDTSAFCAVGYYNGSSWTSIHSSTVGWSTATDSITLSASQNLANLQVSACVSSLSIRDSSADWSTSNGLGTLTIWDIRTEGIGATSAAPSNVVGTPAANGTSATVTWADNATDETAYGIDYCSGSGCSTWTTLTTSLAANTQSYTHTGLSPGGVYRYRVYAINWAGNAPASTSDVVMPSIPTAPSAFTVTGSSTNHYITLNWGDNSNNETGFAIERCAGSGCTGFAPLVTTAANATSYQDSSPVSGTIYNYHVGATNAVGTSAFTSSAQASIVLPATPTSLVATAAPDSNYIDLAWTDNASTETGYTVERCIGAGCSTFTPLSTTLGANANSYHDSGLTAGTYYNYRVTATNGTVGNSAYSNTSQTSVINVPTAPSSLASVNVYSTSVNSSWTAGSGQTGYSMERCSGASCSSFAEVATPSNGATTLSDASLTAGTAYSYRIRAHNGVGYSGYSNTISITTQSALGTPTSLAGTAAAAGTSVALSWTDNSASETSFSLERCTGSGCTSFAQIATPVTNATSYSDTGLTPGTSYVYRMRAVNINDSPMYSAYSGSVTVTTPNVPADASGFTSASASSGASVQLNWTDNSSNETGFKIDRCTGSGCSSWSTKTSPPLSPNTITWTDSTVVPSTTYSYRVTAINDVGSSTTPPTTSITTPSVPAAPTSLSAVASSTAATITLTWADNATNETGYKVMRCADYGCSAFSLLNTPPANATSFTDTGLDSGRIYNYQVLAYNDVGNSGNSNTAGATTIDQTYSLSTAYVTLYTYDALGNLLCVEQHGNASSSSVTCSDPTDHQAGGNWRVRKFQYDSLGHLIESVNPESGKITYTYDDDGNLTKKTAPRANQTSAIVTNDTNYSYDALHRLTGKTYQYDGSAITYSYDDATYNSLTTTNGIGRRTGMSDETGATGWSFDAMGRVLTDRRTTAGVSKSIATAYNLDGSVSSLTYPSGAVVSYGYDAAGRQNLAQDTAHSITYAKIQSPADYWPSGQVHTMYYVSDTSSGVQLVNSYNNRLQPATLQAISSAGTIFSLTYGYNQGTAGNPLNNGNIVQIRNDLTYGTGSADRTQNFTYDGLNRIRKASTEGTGWGETYDIDPWGNLNKISGVLGRTYTESLNDLANGDNRLPLHSYDAAGNMVDGSTYMYNAQNLISNTASIDYKYDGEGERVEKLVSTTERELYWGSGPLAEGDLAGNISNEYVFFDGKRIAKRDSTGAVNYYLADELGTSRMVLSASGVVLDDQDFYPYGAVASGSSTSGNHYKFTGKERDPESGLDYFGARFYGSGLGRWLTPDWSERPAPVPYADFTEPQSLNLYGYVRNSPITRSDVDGHMYGVGQNIDVDAAGSPGEDNNSNTKDSGGQPGGSVPQAAQSQSCGFFCKLGNLLTGNGWNPAPPPQSSPTSSASPVDKNKMADYINSHANGTGKFGGQCAKSCRKAMEAGGVKTAGHPEIAKNYGPFLVSHGAALVSQENYHPQKGDVAVFQGGGRDKSGHIQIYDGKQWVSDTKQPRFSPRRDYPGGFAIYRFPN